MLENPWNYTSQEAQRPLWRREMPLELLEVVVGRRAANRLPPRRAALGYSKTLRLRK